ncbi:MAG: hypothetical protein NTNFB02_14360 [Nitrospira sp.]
MAMQDVYDFFYDVNLGLTERGLQRLDDMLRPAIRHTRRTGSTDFRKNQRGELGTRTATLHKEGIEKLRTNWVYKLDS